MHYDSSPFALLEVRRAEVDTVRENSARRARSTATWTTQGIGEIRVDTWFDLGIRFVEEPCFTSGMVLDESTDLVSGHFPRAQAGVYEWHRDASGYYIGAYLFFIVDTVGPGQLPGVEPAYKIHHHLCWEGTAFKDLPAHLLDL